MSSFTTRNVVLALAALTSITTASPINTPRAPAWQLAFHSGSTCNSTIYYTAAGNGPSDGCATVTSDGVTVAAAGAASVSDPGFTVTWYAEPGCKNQVPIEVSSAPGTYNHCDAPQTSGEGPLAYYTVTQK